MGDSLKLTSFPGSAGAKVREDGRRRMATFRVIPDCGSSQAVAVREGRSSQRLAANRNADVGAAIVLLLFPCGPSYIAGLVVTIIVNALDGVLGRRSRSDIRKERLERFAPAVADADASPAVILVAAIPWIQTACLHVRPDATFRAVTQAVRPFTSDGAGVTAAAPALAVCQGRGGDAAFCSAGASAEPMRDAVLRADVIDDKPASERAANEILAWLSDSASTPGSESAFQARAGVGAFSPAVATTQPSSASVRVGLTWTDHDQSPEALSDTENDWAHVNIISRRSLTAVEGYQLQKHLR